MRPSTSSRLNPKVIWVRSFVPKEKKSASSAISPATRAARGVSIMVPMSTSTVPRRTAFVLVERGADAEIASPAGRRLGLLDRRFHPRAGESQFLAVDGERDHDLDHRVAAGLDALAAPPP